jgi:hypothetical protein
MQILLALFCLGIALYAWRAWRANPLYSLKSTLMNAAVILLGLALAVGFTELIAFHLFSQSLAVMLMGIMALISAITLAMSAASMRITDGPIAKLPAGTSPENNNRRPLIPWFLGVGLALLLLLGWAALASPADAEMPAGLAAVVLCASSASLGSLYIKARRTDYASSAVKSTFWVHWQDAYGQSETWLGPDGLLVGGAYTPWLTSGNYLTEARVERGLTVSLLLTFVKLSGASGAPRTIRVLVPEGRESDVELLEEKLRARCPKARVDFGVASRANG